MRLETAKIKDQLTCRNGPAASLRLRPSDARSRPDPSRAGAVDA